MRASRIILLLVALVAGGLAAYFFVVTTNTPPQQVVVEAPAQIIPEQKARILVAKTPIGVGQRLTEETIEWQDWPELAVRPEYITDSAVPDALTQMDGAIARFEFFPGEPILQAKLVHSDQGYLSAVLSRSGETGPVSQTILENVKVLAIGTRLGETGTTGAKANPEDPKADVFAETIAVLELNPAQGERVINSTRLGTLSLVLRSIADYAQTVETEKRNTANRAIRVVRFGRNQDISSPGIDAEVTAASYGGEGEQATGE
jgi:pilus assembly protein CpaB